MLPGAVEDGSPEDVRGGSDIDIEVGKYADPLTVLELLQEMRKSHRPFEEEWWATADMAEQYVNGYQQVSLDINDADSLPDAVWGSEFGRRVTRNVCRNLVLTWASSLLENRPSFRAWPSDGSGYDLGAMHVAQRIIEHQYQVQDIDALTMRAAKLVQPHTAVGIKITWDPDAGPSADIPVLDDAGMPAIGEDGQPLREVRPLGEVRWDLVTIFNYITDGSEHIEDAKWCAFRRYMDKHEAKYMLREAGVEDDPDVANSENQLDPREVGVEVWEIWHRPDVRIPRGLFAVVVGGHVVDSRPFPYDHKQLPLCVWKASDRSDHPYGSSQLHDALPAQQIINQTLTVSRDLQRRIGDYVKLVGPSSIIDQIEAEHQMFAIEDPQQAHAIKYIEPPTSTVNELRAIAESEEEAAYRTFGLNEMLAGAESAKSNTSGRAIAYLKELDGRKMAESSRNLGECQRRAWNQTLRLAQQYVDQERTLLIAGPNREPSVIAFKGADIQGVDVILEPSSGLERYRAAQAGQGEEMAMAGMLDPNAAAHMSQTGLWDSSPDEMTQRRLIQEDAQLASQGHQVQPRPDVNPEFALQELHESLDVFAANPQAQNGIWQLILAYREMGYQMSNQVNNQQQANMPEPPPADQPPTTPAGLPLPPQGGY